MDRNWEHSQLKSKVDHSAHLITLITHQDLCFQNWMKFMILVEVSLASADAFLLSHAGDTAPWPKVAGVFAIVVPVVGILVLLCITTIMVREHKWQHLLANKYAAIPGNSGKVFPERLQEVSSLPIGHNSLALIGLASFIAILWALSLYLVVAQTGPGSLTGSPAVLKSGLDSCRNLPCPTPRPKSPKP